MSEQGKVAPHLYYANLENVTAPLSQLTLSSAHSGYIIAVDASVAGNATIALPANSSRLTGFACKLLVVAAGNHLIIDTNGNTVLSSIKGSNTNNSNDIQITSPQVGVFVELFCNGNYWIVQSEYAHTLPAVVTSTGQTLATRVDGSAVVPTNLAADFTLTLGSAATAKGKLFRVAVRGAVTTTKLLTIAGASKVFTFKNISGTAAEVTGSATTSLVIGDAAGTNDVKIGDSFTLASDGTNWFISGASLGLTAFS